jgi:transposase
MEKLSRRVYTAEFRRQAVEMITRGGLSIAAASRRLSISPKTLANRVRWARDGTSPEAGGDMPRRAATAEEAELSRLRRETVELRMERDILKKSPAYFAQESLRGTR